MNAATICLSGLFVFWLGYRYYSRYLARKVFDLRDDEDVPAVTLEDGIDFVPTNKHVLLGHHYSSIAGAAPIIGPAIAVIWGWLPAVLWVVLGTVFMGAVHDFATLVMSVRHQGRSVGSIVADVIGPRTRVLFLLVIFFLVMLVIAVFAGAVAELFVKKPGTVIPINFEIVIAVVIGWWCYRRGRGLLWPSIFALLALYALVWVGTQYPVSMSFLGNNAHTGWVVALLAYSFVASILPVWVLLQPRDYINSHQLFVGLALLVLGIVVAHPTMVAPAINTNVPDDAPSWFPFLFVMIACGAISGFHGLVASGTTSKQLSCATDARAVGYGGMIGEGTLALIATIAVGAGLADWAGHYHSFGEVAKSGVVNFVEGAATFLVAIGLPRGPGEVVVAVLVISFAATSLDTGVRIQRYICHEIGEAYGIRALLNRYVAAGIAVAIPLVLVLGGKAKALWPLFGTSNQVLAGLSLTIVSVWLYRSAKVWIHVAIPMVIVIVLAAIAMLANLVSYWHAENYLLLFFGTAILALQLWVVLEGIWAVRRIRAQRHAMPAARARAE